MTRDQDMSFVEHLEELRRRLLVCLGWVLAGTVAAYRFSPEMLQWLAKPAGGLVFLAPADAFLARLKLSLMGGLFLAVPFILLELWGFVVQALTRRERNALVWILPASYVLFSLGASLALFVVLPSAVRFLLTYGSAELRPLLSVDAALRFSFGLALAFGFLFQLPLALFFLNRLGLVTPLGLACRRRLVYLGSFVLAAFLTPGPDVFSQLLLALPTIILYEIALAAMRCFPPQRAPLGAACDVTQP